MDNTHKTLDTNYSAPESMASPSLSHILIALTLSSCSASTLLAAFGGRVDDLYTFLTEERLPNGWESRIRDQMGMTIFAFNRSSLHVELGIDEELNQPLNLT